MSDIEPTPDATADVESNEISEEQRAAAQAHIEQTDRDREAQERETTPVKREVVVDPVAANIEESQERLRRVQAGELSVSDLHDAKSESDPVIRGQRESYIDNVAKTGRSPQSDTVTRPPDYANADLRDGSVLELDDRLKALEARLSAVESTLEAAFREANPQPEISAAPTNLA